MPNTKLLIEYKNKEQDMDGLYSLNAIAKANGLLSKALKKHYENAQVPNIYEAIDKAKEAQKLRNGNIVYNGENISLKQLANKLNLSNTSLSRNYKKLGNIEEAIAVTKKAHDTRFENIELSDGSKVTIGSIAKENGIVDHILMDLYEKYGDVETALEIAKQNQASFHGKILYNKDGQTHTANYIAKDNNVHPDVFKKYYNKTGNVEKAIILAKEGQRKYNKNGKKTSSPKTHFKNIKKDNSYQINHESLHSYCIEHAMNYDVICNLIDTYSMSTKDAIAHYQKHGQNIPTQWIYEKYGVLLRHLLLSFNLNPDRIIKTMRAENCNIHYALEKYIFTTDNKELDFSSSEISLLFEIYQFSKVCSTDEYNEVLKEFYIDKEELNFINIKKEKIDLLERKILLFDFAQVINRWEEQDIISMMDEYQITNEEVVEIYSSLYTPFEDKVLLGINSKERKYATKVENFIKTSYNDDDITLQLKIDNTDFQNDDKNQIVSKIKQIQNTINELEECRTHINKI